MIYDTHYYPNVAKKLNLKKIHKAGLIFYYIKRKKSKTYLMKIYQILVLTPIWFVAIMYPNQMAQSGSS